MSPSAQQLAIAKELGWHLEESDRPGGWVVFRNGMSKPEVTQFRWFMDKVPTLSDAILHLPDYLHDLNSMHEAERILVNQFDTKWETYWRHLQHVMPHPMFATAAQRAEAFLRTVGKWVET